MQAPRAPRYLGFFLWLLVGLSVSFWGLRLGESGGPPAADAPGAPDASLARGVDAAALMAVLAGVQAPAAMPTTAAPRARIELRGVIAHGRHGVALLSVDGQPGQPVPVGARVQEGLVLRAVGVRHAELADSASGAVVQRLELPPEAALPAPAGLAFVQAPR